MVKHGSIRLDVLFAEALANTVNSFVYAEYDNILEVDASRQATVDFSGWISKVQMALSCYIYVVDVVLASQYVSSRDRRCKLHKNDGFSDRYSMSQRNTITMH